MADRYPPQAASVKGAHCSLTAFCLTGQAVRLRAEQDGFMIAAFRGLQAPGQTAIPSKRCATLALPRRLRMGGTPTTFPHSRSALRAGAVASVVTLRIQGI